MTRLAAALEFMTVLRFRRRDTSFDQATFAASQAFYPLVGLLIGGITAGAWLLLDRALPRLPADMLAVVLLVALTGGLHLDGLGDTADGLLGPHERESRLAIMRDPRAGSFAVIAIAGVLLLKWSALLGVADREHVFAALLTAPVLARGALVFTTGRYPYARPTGMGAGFPEAARGPAGTFAAVTAIVTGAAIYGAPGALLAAALAGSMILLARWPDAALGGLTGDVYGALIEIAETVFLLVAAAGSRHGWLEPLWLGGRFS